MRDRPVKKIRPRKKKGTDVKFKGEQHTRYHSDQEMLEHVKGYMGETHWKIVRSGIERRTFGNIDHTVLYFTLKPKDEKAIPSYRYQIYDNGIPRAGGAIHAN